MPQITAIPAFHDNYIWLISDGNHAAVVDPGDAKPVIRYLQQHSLTLTDILITHHHADHTGGVQALLNAFHPTVHAPYDTPLPHCDHRVSEGDTVSLNKHNLEFHVLNTPGHTLDHICYVNLDTLFCGDTLFVGGCGRIFEGTADMMLESLEKLAELPHHTAIYCAHEYTVSNYRFAIQADPDNTALQAQIHVVNEKRSNKIPTVPSRIAIELATNPFLRCHTAAIADAVNRHTQLQLTDKGEIFAHLREWKNHS